MVLFLALSILSLQKRRLWGDIAVFKYPKGCQAEGDSLLSVTPKEREPMGRHYMEADLGQT